METHTGEKTFCDVRESNLTQNMEFQTSGKKYCCNICKKCFKFKLRLKKHINTHKRETPFFCIVCQGSFSVRKYLTQHLKIHTCEKTFWCKVCEKYFKSKTNLRHHMKIHSEFKPFFCSVCKKIFRHSVNLREHLNSHAHEKPFCCSICQRSYKVKSSLTQHMKVHTQNPFCCSVCNKWFSCKRDVSKHMDIHKIENLFWCRFCQRSFREKASLTRHLKVHTFENFYKENMMTHMRLNTDLKGHSFVSTEQYNDMKDTRNQISSCFVCSTPDSNFWYHVNDGDCYLSFCDHCRHTPVLCALCGRILEIASLRHHIAKHTGEMIVSGFSSSIEEGGSIET